MVYCSWERTQSCQHHTEERGRNVSVRERSCVDWSGEKIQSRYECRFGAGGENEKFNKRDD